MFYSIFPFSFFFIQFQEALFKGSGKLELLICTAESNDDQTSVNALDPTGSECLMGNDRPGMDL